MLPMRVRFRALGIALLAAVIAGGLIAKFPGKVGAAQSDRMAAGARLLRGALDLHVHMDPRAPGPTTANDRADLSTAKLARERGMRGLVIKDHYHPTAPLAYHMRLEVPGIDLFGGFVMNRANGGINVPGVEFMATLVRGEPGRIVWMPAGDSEIEVRQSKEPNRHFVAVSRNGALLPEVKQVLSIVARHRLVIASGHIAPEEALMVFREARSLGVQHMIATHAMDLAGKMTMAQMQQAAKLGAFIEFDMRNVLEGGRVEAIRTLGPQVCFLTEFWTKAGSTSEYASLEGIGAFAEAMHARGFSDQELDLLFKENPARILGLPAR
jgi:hypothetical protein